MYRMSAPVREPILSAGQVDAVAGFSCLSAVNLRGSRRSGERSEASLGGGYFRRRPFAATRKPPDQLSYAANMIPD